LIEVFQKAFKACVHTLEFYRIREPRCTLRGVKCLDFRDRRWAKGLGLVIALLSENASSFSQEGKLGTSPTVALCVVEPAITIEF
jgi:hypothetical protein